MNDSLFNAKGFLNYWTTMDIKHEQTYRITANGANEKTSQVTVTTPTELPPIYITVNARNPFYETTPGAGIYIDDADEHIADLQSVWYVILNPETEQRKKIYTFPLRNTLEYSAAFGDSYAFANWDKQREQIEQSAGGAEIVVASRQFFVATGGPEWNDSLTSINDLQYFLDGEASNVENGLGYVVGINSGWFRQIPCLAPDESRFVPCTPDDGPYWYSE